MVNIGEIITNVGLERLLISNNLEEQKWIAMIAIFEGYLYKVSKKHFNNIKSNSYEQMNFIELGLVYEKYLKKDSGMHGVCWESIIYYLIYYNNTYMQDLINMAINYLSGELSFQRIEAILWGGEKKQISIENIKNRINDNDRIWTPHWTKETGCKFKEYIDIICGSFSKKILRSDLPEVINGIWKTDLFVKKQDSDTWYAVTVKWNGNQIEVQPGLAIGIFFEGANSPRLLFNPSPVYNQYLKKNIFVNCSIPFVNLGELFGSAFRLARDILENIDCNINKSSTINLTFTTNEQFNFFKYFHSYRDMPCIQVINHLKNLLYADVHTMEVKEIIQESQMGTKFINNQVIINNIVELERETGTQIIIN